MNLRSARLFVALSLFPVSLMVAGCNKSDASASAAASASTSAPVVASAPPRVDPAAAEAAWKQKVSTSLGKSLVVARLRSVDVAAEQQRNKSLDGRVLALDDGMDWQSAIDGGSAAGPTREAEVFVTVPSDDTGVEDAMKALQSALPDLVSLDGVDRFVFVASKKLEKTKMNEVFLVLTFTREMATKLAATPPLTASKVKVTLPAENVLVLGRGWKLSWDIAAQ